MQLIVGTDSTWSLRAWMCLQLANVEVSEKVIDLHDRNYKSQILQYSPAGLVPALITETTVIHDSLAITEYINELSPDLLFPENREERAVARSLCAEMHSGFMSLRGQFPFMLTTPEKPTDLDANIRRELARATVIFESANLPFMFESAGAVDAFYAILAFRLKSYGITLEGKAGEYQYSLLQWPLLKRAIEQAEKWHVTASTSADD